MTTRSVVRLGCLALLLAAWKPSEAQSSCGLVFEVEVVPDGEEVAFVNNCSNVVSIDSLYVIFDDESSGASSWRFGFSSGSEERVAGVLDQPEADFVVSEYIGLNIDSGGSGTMQVRNDPCAICRGGEIVVDTVLVWTSDPVESVTLQLNAPRGTSSEGLDSRQVEMLLHPNPSIDRIIIDMENELIPFVAQIEIVDLSGRIVYKIYDHNTSYYIDVSSLQGSFILRAKSHIDGSWSHIYFTTL